MQTPMDQLPESPMSKMYKAHIGFILAKDVGGLLDQYTEDCVLISTLTPDRQPRYVRGHAELKQFFEGNIFSLEGLECTLTQWAEHEDPQILMMVEDVTVTGTDGSVSSMSFYDNWFLRNGKIAIHFAGVVRYPDGTYADGTGFAEGQAPAKHEPPENTPLGKLYREHIGFILDKNVDGILNQYDPDALLIGTLTEGRKPRYVRGHDELRTFFNGNFMGLKSLTSQIDQWAEIDNGLMVVESIHFEGMDGSTAEMSFYDNWVLRDGKIIMHYAGVVRYPDGSYA